MTESLTKQPQRGCNAMNDQQKLNARASAIGAQINVIVGWLVVDKDGNEYAVRKAAELDALIVELEQQENTEQDKKYLDDKWISDKESFGGSAYLLWMWKLCEKEAWQKATDNKSVEWMLNSVNYDVMRNED